MNTITLHLDYFPYYGSHLKHGDPVEWNGLLWFLCGYRYYKHNDPYDSDSYEMKSENEESIWVECKPVNEDLSFRCEARIQFGNSKKHDINFLINHLLSNKTEESKELDTYSGFRPEIFGEKFDAQVTVKKFEILPKYFFGFKDFSLSDIELIVGDKKLYTSKHILALYSKKFYQIIYGQTEPVNQIEIGGVHYESFRRFLEILHGYNHARIKKEDIYEICGLAIQLDSKICLDQCITSYLHLTPLERHELEHTVFNLRCIAGKDYLVPIAAKPENTLDFYCKLAAKNRPSPTIYTKIFDCKDSKVTKFFVIDGLPFKVDQHYNRWKKSQDITIECLYKDGTKLWKCVILLNHTGYSFNPSKECFNAVNRFVITRAWCDTTTSVYMGIEAFWSPCPEEDINFEIARDKLTDMVLSVGDKKYHVSKQILANSSTYFYSFFYSDFTERDKSEIELKEVDAADFEEFLQHVYYPKRFVQESKLESLLQLSQYYNAHFLHKKCVDYILFDMRATDAQKMVLAVKHGLDDLFKNLAARIETVDDFIAFSKLKGFDELDKKTIAMIKPEEKNCLKRKLDAETSDA